MLQSLLVTNIAHQDTASLILSMHCHLSVHAIIGMGKPQVLVLWFFKTACFQLEDCMHDAKQVCIAGAVQAQAVA